VTLSLSDSRLSDGVISWPLEDITGCRFRKGGWFSKPRLVVATAHGEFVWTTSDAGETFAAAVRWAAFDARPAVVHSGFCELVLIDCGPNKLHVIKAIREATGAGLKEAKDLAEAVPVVVAATADPSVARAFQRRLEAAGARAETRGVAETPVSRPDGARRQVVLVDAGPMQIEVIRVIRAVTGCGLHEAKRLTDAAPAVVGSGWDPGAAAELQRRLEAAGARVNVR
jgi:large subunit ribosomal protein L7/L12